jgi:hypothetical protein
MIGKNEAQDLDRSVCLNHQFPLPSDQRLIKFVFAYAVCRQLPQCPDLAERTAHFPDRFRIGCPKVILRPGLQHFNRAELTTLDHSVVVGDELKSRHLGGEKTSFQIVRHQLIEKQYELSIFP